MVVAAVADEEHASLGVQEVLRTVRADAAIVTEPTELELAIAHKGFVWAEIEVTGRAAHGSRPHLGVDAIVKTGPILTALAALDPRRRPHHPLLGAGLAARVADRGRRGAVELSRALRLKLERRTLPGETVADFARSSTRCWTRCRAADPELVRSSARAARSRR